MLVSHPFLHNLCGYSALALAVSVLPACKRGSSSDPSDPVHVSASAASNETPNDRGQKQAASSAPSTPANSSVSSSASGASSPTVILEPPGRPPVLVRVEVADTPELRERGLMYRTSLQPDTGMLFVFERQTQQTFWMRNTRIPLDMIFIGRDHRVVGVVESATPNTDTPRNVPGASQFVLEVPGGFARERGIGPGTRVRWKNITSELLTHVEQSPARTLVLEPTKPDPVSGKWTLTKAFAGLPLRGKRVAEIKTSMGTLRCELDTARAPNTVANFVGLARGIRPWWDAAAAKWVKRPLYDGTTFHRVIAGFMIQGGDALGDGSGGVGYVIADEVHPDHSHDRAGQLCMANRGPNTNGGQFFITDGASPHLDGGYTIFGQCEPLNVIAEIARSAQSGPPLNRPLTPVVIEAVTIR